MTDPTMPGPSGHGTPPAESSIPVQSAASPQRRKLTTGAIVGIASGAIAVVVAIALVVAFAVVPGTQAAKASGPSDVVRAFFTALSKSDAKAALRHVDQVQSATYLTNAMVRGANELAPIGHIKVGASTAKGKYEASVPVSYAIGDEKYRMTLTVFKYNGDNWKVSDPSKTLTTSSFAPLGLTLNGVAVKGESIRVFPGAYQLAVTNPDFTLEGEARIIFGFNESPDLLSIKPTLSEKGLATFSDVVGKAVNACLASRNLDAGCGLNTPGQASDGTTIVDGTLSRTLSAGAAAKLADPKPFPRYDDPLVMEGEYLGTINSTAQCQKDGQQGECRLLHGGTALGKPIVDFSTSPAVLTWDSLG